MTKKILFTTAKALDALIAQYFEYTDERHLPTKPEKKISARKAKSIEEKAQLYQPGCPTFSGLALHLGFSTLQEYQEYAAEKQRFAVSLKRAWLRIAAIYENKLHTHSYGGAVHALKCVGWGEKANHNTTEASDTVSPKVEIIHSGIVTASNEKEVIL